MHSLHHTHLMAADIDVTMTFWVEHFGAEILHDVEFAGARNVFMRIGSGRLHLYSQPPKHRGQGTVHHVGIETDSLKEHVDALKRAGVSVSEIKSFPDASYAMVEGPDALLIELFQINPKRLSKKLEGYFETAPLRELDE